MADITTLLARFDALEAKVDKLTQGALLAEAEDRKARAWTRDTTRRVRLMYVGNWGAKEATDKGDLGWLDTRLYDQRQRLMAYVNEAMGLLRDAIVAELRAPSSSATPETFRGASPAELARTDADPANG